MPTVTSVLYWRSSCYFCHCNVHIFWYQEFKYLCVSPLRATKLRLLMSDVFSKCGVQETIHFQVVLFSIQIIFACFDNHILHSENPETSVIYCRSHFACLLHYSYFSKHNLHLNEQHVSLWNISVLQLLSCRDLAPIRKETNTSFSKT